MIKSSNKLKIWFSVFFISFFAIITTGCGDDEKDEPSTTTNNGTAPSSKTNVKSVLTSHRWSVRTEDIIGEKYHDILLESYYFLDNGKGVIDCTQRSESIYGDKDRYSYTAYFTYTVSGNTVSIKRDAFSSAISFTFNTTSLVGSEDYVLTAQELTAEDRERIAQAKYETMDDDERLDISLGFINEEEILGLATESKYKYYSRITWGISVQASEHVYSRGIMSIRADFKIEGGQLCSGGNSLQLNMDIYEDKNQSEITDFEFYRDADAKLIVKIYEYDLKQKKEVYINTFEFKYTNNPNIGGDPTGSDNKFSELFCIPRNYHEHYAGQPHQN